MEICKRKMGGGGGGWGPCDILAYHPGGSRKIPSSLMLRKLSGLMQALLSIKSEVVCLFE